MLYKEKINKKKNLLNYLRVLWCLTAGQDAYKTPYNLINVVHALWELT